MPELISESNSLNVPAGELAGANSGGAALVPPGDGGGDGAAVVTGASLLNPHLLQACWLVTQMHEVVCGTKTRYHNPRHGTPHQHLRTENA